MSKDHLTSTQKNPDVDGLQDPVLGQRNQWVLRKSNFVQFPHINGNHWIAISNIGDKRGTVNIYDSLQMIPTTNTENLITQFIRDDFMKLTYRVQQVQKQTNGYDYGVFTIAFATSLLNGDDPAALVCRSDMRQHLFQCLRAKEISVPI